MATEIDHKSPFMVPKPKTPVLTGDEQRAIYKAIQDGWRGFLTSDLRQLGPRSKIRRFKANLVRKHYGIAMAAGVSPARKKELLRHTYLARDVDNRLYDDGKEFNQRLTSLMSAKDSPESFKALEKKAKEGLNQDFNAEFALKMFAHVQTGKALPTWGEFTGSFGREVLV